MINVYDSAWSKLPLDLQANLRPLFKHSLLLQASFDSAQEAEAICRDCNPGLWSKDDLLAYSRIMEDWRNDLEPCFKRMRLQMVQHSGCLNDAFIDRPVFVSSSSNEYPSTVQEILRPVLKPLKFKSRLAKKLSLTGDPLERTKLEQFEKNKWSDILASLFEEAKLPVCRIWKQCSSPELARLQSFGSRRGPTLKSRARLWIKVRDWLMIEFHRPFPFDVTDMINYLNVRGLEPCGRSFPNQLSATLAFIEDCGRVDHQDKISGDRSWSNTVRYWEQKLIQDAEGGTSVHKAQIPTIAMVISMELFLANIRYPLHLRAMCWIKLLKLWMALRFYDTLGIDPNRILLTDRCLKIILVQTKTTGPGKKTWEVPAYVSRTASLSGLDWIRIGLEIWESDLYRFPRDFYVMKSDDSLQQPLHKMIDYSMATAYSRAILENLKVPFRNQIGEWKESEKSLIPIGMGKAWTEHSERHWLVSIAATLGIGKEQRDFIGRWGLDQHQSNDYLLTSKQVILQVQTLVMKRLCEGGELTYDETELLQFIHDEADKVGANPIEVQKNHDLLLHSATQGSCLLQSCPVLLLTGPAVDSLIPEFIAPQPEESSASVNPAKSAPYWISINNRSGFRRLHRSGCGILPWNCTETLDIFVLNSEVADSYCKRCFPSGPDFNRDAQESSSSESSSESEGGLERALEMPVLIVDPSEPIPLVSID